MNTSVSARTPGKITLSGEHAVLLGYPAIGLTIDRYITATFNKNKQLGKLSYCFSNLKVKGVITFDALKTYAHPTGRFECASELALYACALFDSVYPYLEHACAQKQGLSIHIEGTLPLGRGLGSSAATALSTVFALNAFLGAKLPEASLVELAKRVETRQHSKSSGFDVTLCHQGNMCMPLPARYIDTGMPASTTGDCVAHTLPILRRDSLGTAFEATCTAMTTAQQQNDLSALVNAIRANHRLLTQIGVVPNKVQQFIQAIEERGGGAKICGAGSIAGDAAGFVMAVCDKPIDDLVHAHGYCIETLNEVGHGTQIL